MNSKVNYAGGGHGCTLIRRRYNTILQTRFLWPPPAIRFYRCSLDLILFSPRNLRGRLADRRQASPVRWWPGFIKFDQKIGCPSPPPKKSCRPQKQKFRRDFVQLRDFVANVSGTQQDIVNRKAALQLQTLPHSHFVLWSTVDHKRWKIELEFWPTQRAAIRLGIITHLVYY